MTDHVALLVLSTALATLCALMIAAGAGFLARRDGATYAQAITRAGAAFAATLTLCAALAITWHTLTH